MPSKRLRVLLTFTRGNDHQVEQLGGSVVANFFGNKSFAAPPVDQATVQSALTDFTTAVAASGQGGIHLTANTSESCLSGVISGPRAYVQVRHPTRGIHFYSQFPPFAVSSSVRRHISEDILTLQFQGNLSTNLL